MFIDNDTDKLIFKGIRSEKQKLFIQLYCNPESESYDNATQSYLQAYNSENSNVAGVESHRMLDKKNIKNSVIAYRAYIYEQNGFELSWLDANLRNLYYKVKNSGNMEQTELRILKTIGDRIGAFTDTTEVQVGKTVPMTPEQERACNKVFADYLAQQTIKTNKEVNPAKIIKLTLRDKESLEN